jgi:hypothetical protein
LHKFFIGFLVSRPLSSAFFLFSLLVLSPSAQAGAFLAKPGEGQLILSSTFSASQRGYDGQGQLTQGPNIRKTEVSAYLEYGLSDWATLLFSPDLEWLSQRQVGQTQIQSYSGIGLSQLGGRFKVLEGHGQILSLQITALTPNWAERAFGNDQMGADARLQYGTSFHLFDKSGFFDAQIGARHFAGALRNEMRLDLTLGYNILPQVMLLAQNFNVLAPARGALPQSRTHKLQGSAVYQINKNWSAQLGAFSTLAARNAAQERGLTTGLWYRF